jgi:hypothetical protein
MDGKWGFIRDSKYAVAEALADARRVLTPADVRPNEQDGIEQIAQPDEPQSVLESVRCAKQKAQKSGSFALRRLTVIP